MSTNEEVEQYFYKTILALSVPAMKEKEIGRDDLFDLVGIPDDLRGVVFNWLWNGEVRYIDGKPALKNPLIKINKHGLQLVEEIKNQIFDQTGEIVDTQVVNMSLQETFEVIFQKHLQNGGSLYWHKQTFDPPFPANLNAAKEMMLNKKTIVQSSTDKRRTVINADLIDCKNYAEAVERLNMDQLKNSSIAINIGGNFNGNLNNQSLNTTQSSQPTPATDNNNAKKIDWSNILKWSAAVVAATVTILKAFNVI